MTVFVVPFNTVSPGTSVSNSTSAEYLSWSPLGSDKYIITYRQTSTNGIVSRVITYNGATSEPTYGPVNLIQSTTTSPYSEFQKIRVYQNPLSPASAFVLYASANYGLYLQFLDISETGIITPGTAVNVLDKTYFNKDYSHMFEMISATKLIGIYNIPNTTSRSFITLDFENKTFSVSERETITPRSEYNTTTTRMRCSKIPNTTKTLVCDGVSLYEVDETGVTTRTYDTSSWGLINKWNIKPIGENSLLHVHYYDNNVFLRRFENGIPQGFNFVSCTNDLGMNFNTAIPLEPYHMMVVAESNSGLNIQTVRLLTDGVGECSGLTHKSGGMKLNTSSSAITSSNYHFSTHYSHYLPSWDKREDGTILYWFIANGDTGANARLAFKVMYIPPVE